MTRDVLSDRTEPNIISGASGTTATVFAGWVQLSTIAVATFQSVEGNSDDEEAAWERAFESQGFAKVMEQGRARIARGETSPMRYEDL